MFALIWKSSLSFSLLLTVAGLVDAGPPIRAGRSYPLVYGATGRPYGPTQAEYQYRLRYGRPWHGGGGQQSSRFYSSGASIGWGSDYYISPFGTTSYAPIYGLNTPIYAIPNVFYSGPVYPQFGAYGYYGEIPGVPTINHVPFQNGANGQTMIGQGFQPDPFQPQPNAINHPVDVAPVIEESTPVQRERALRWRVMGDEAFAKTDYRTAGEHYRESMQSAPDVADARYRYAITLAARSRFDEAVEHLKIATELDLNWPAQGVTLDQLYHLQDPNDWMKRDEKNRIKTRIAEWTNRDVRDPNRLFLLAAVMMLDGDVRAKGLLETAIRLNGIERHLVAFLRPLVDGESIADNEVNPTPVAPRVFEPGRKVPGFVPPEPGQQRGEIVGEERARRVFEKTPDEIPALPEDLVVPPSAPIPANPLPLKTLPEVPIPADPPIVNPQIPASEQPEPGLLSPGTGENGPLLPPRLE